MSHSKLLICPYCGETQRQRDACKACGGRFDALSRQATQNEMGPWFIRAEGRAYTPGCSYEAMVRQIERGQITKVSIVRGPTTRQFWTIARRVPGLSHLLGYCHECDGKVSADDHHCGHCGVAFGAYLDRDWLGLPDVRPLPGEAPDGDPGASGSGWARPALAPQARGLSSFASNDELMAPGPATAIAEPPTETAAAAAPPTSPSREPADVSVSAILASPAGRAMQQRTRRLVTANRVLVVALIVVGLAGVAVNLALLAQTSTLIPAPASELAEESGAEPAPGDGDLDSLAIPEPILESEDDAPGNDDSTPAPSTDGAAAAPPAPLDQLRAAVASAEGTTAEAARLMLFRQALDVAHDIDPAALARESDRTAYATLRASIEREIERLELRESFFGDG